MLTLQVGGEFSNGMGGFGGPLDGIDIPEPGAAVGIVIPKVGEIIKNIKQETGAKVQFEQEDGQSKGRLCSITGPQDKVKQAQMINNSNVSALLYQKSVFLMSHCIFLWYDFTAK